MMYEMVLIMLTSKLKVLPNRDNKTGNMMRDPEKSKFSNNNLADH